MLQERTVVGDREIKVLAALKSLKIPVREKENKLKKSVCAILAASKINVLVVPNISFSINELEHDHRILTIFINIINSQILKSKDSKAKKEEATVIANKLKAFIDLVQNLDKDIACFSEQKFQEVVMGRLTWWKATKEETSDSVLAKLGQLLQKPEENDVFLRDIIHFIQQLSALAEDEDGFIRSFQPCSDYSQQAKAFSLVKAELSGWAIFQKKCLQLIKKLTQVFEEGKDTEKGRLAKIYISRLRKDIPKIKLTCMPHCLPYCYFGPKEESSVDRFCRSVSAYEDSYLAAYSYTNANVKLDQYNGDSFLISETSKAGVTFTAVVDAANHTIQSKNAAESVIKSLFEEAQKSLSEGCTLHKLILHLLTQAHFAALEANIPCKLAFNFVFPSLMNSNSYSCVGGAIGDVRAFFLYTQPDLLIQECNADTPARPRFSSLGAVGEIFKVSQLESLKFDFWHFEVPPGTFVILETYEMYKYIKAETLQKSPRVVSEEMECNVDENDSTDWREHEELYHAYSKQLILETFKKLPVDEEEGITAPQLGYGLMEHCSKVFESLGEKESKLRTEDLTILVHKLPPLRT